jgi:hypothetical protein
MLRMVKTQPRGFMNIFSNSLTYLKAGLIAGLAAAVLNIIIYSVLVIIGGHEWAVVVAGSILVASVLPNVLAALVFFGLSKITTGYARPLLAVGVVLFVLVSILPHLGIGPAPSPALAALPEGFDLVTVPLHIVFGLTAVFFLVPWLVNRNAATSAVA